VTALMVAMIVGNELLAVFYPLRDIIGQKE
jgi:hypothetical protein